MNPGNFFAELKRRNVYKIAVAYAVVAWLLVQVATQVFPFFEIPIAAVQLVVLLLIFGFPVVMVLAWAFEITPEGIKRGGGSSPNESRTLRAGRALTAGIVIVAAAAAGVTLFRLLPAPAVRDGEKKAAPAVPIDNRAIAVLPFENLSDDASNAYFVSGVRDEILTSLAQLRDLTVRSRTSTQRYQSHPEDLALLSRELGVATVLEGSVQKAAEDVLINVQLIDTRNRSQLWAQSYRRTVKDVFSVQGEVAQEVADALKIELAPAQEQRLHVPPTSNAVAHDLFLRAHELGAHADEHSLEKKIELLQEAVKEDPHYARAWGDLAGAYLTIADAYRAPLDVLSPMRHAALMAVKNGEGDGLGHIWLGSVSMLYDRNFPLAKHELERAVELAPSSSDAHRWLGWYRARVEGDFVAGRAEVQRARALDPSYTWPIMFECQIAQARGDYESALQLSQQVMEIDPHFFYDVDPIANVYSAMGRWQDAVARYESLPAGTLTRPNFQLAICYAHVGQIEKTRQIAKDLEELSRHRYVDRTHLAAIYAVLGEKDKAFAALDRACAERSARISTPRFYQWLEPLFNDPRFAALEYKVNHSVLREEKQ
jgi:TolB-like protein/Tfp pilus assembly protein PilF